MRHAAYALFPDARAAEAAINEIERHAELSQDVTDVVQHPAWKRRLRTKTFADTDAMPGMRRGALFGAVLGAIIGALLADPGGLIVGGPMVGAAFGATFGALVTALSLGIAGAGLTDRNLEEVVTGAEGKEVLVTFETGHVETSRRLVEVAERHGGHAVGKALL
ncbi:MAG: hypothetical protein H6704_04320 [Myxococcales bacterium]|nr:hypothetical protein [Myxococcales bacterium]MCB9535468.1 hypothetical protein [Myxococcales bacterium]